MKYYKNQWNVIVNEKVHLTETKLNALGSTNKDGSLKNKQTKKHPALKLVWAGQLQKIEGFCIQDYFFVSKF